MSTEAAPATAPAKPKTTLSSATKTLLFLAARMHSLRDQMGIDLQTTDAGDRISFRPGVPRPWLKPHPTDKTYLSFDPDIYARSVYDCSDGESWCRLFILNVWNPAYARSKGWTFDLFKAVRVLDSSNCEGLAYVIQATPWP